MPVHSALSLVALLVLLPACPGDIERPVVPGAYEAKEQGATLVVNREAGTFTISRPGLTEARTFKARPKAGWLKKCRMSMRSHLVEVLDVQGGPMTVGGKTFARPLAVAGCGAGELRVTTADDKGEDVAEGAVVFTGKP